MAAAYGALVSLLNDLVDIQNHPLHSFSFDSNQIQSLRESVTFLIDFMESYDNCHGPSKEAAQLLEMRITCAAYVAEEVIESHLVDQIRARKTATHFLPKLQRVIEGIDLVKREAVEVQAQLKLKQQPTNSAAAASSTPSLTSEKNSMVGFDKLLLQLLDMLTGHPPSRRVIPIVGTGGIGKTTLARNAFEHPLIVETFDVCVWVTISQQYVVQDILFKLLSQLEKSNRKIVGELGKKLYKSLYGQKYLIVLDDIWSVGSWEDMRLFFPDTSNGSRVVVTTRQSDVAHHLSSSNLAMSLLDNEKSWDLFCEKAFAGGGCPFGLEDVGRKIVRKCKGLPLAIIVVAGHLARSSRKKEYWESVANNMNSVLNSEENKQLLDVLSFSYSHLPVHLKPCFVYMGMLLEDEEISTMEIVRRWIVEGYLKPCYVDNLEETGMDYLKYLIDTNLILANKDFSKVGIHDVLRELCLKIAEKEMFFCVVNTPRAICRERLARAAPLVVRSLIWPKGEVSLELRLLRVLYKSNKYDECLLTKANIELVNLRYLEYRKVETQSPSFHLSPSISLLWNLQTLIIYGGHDVSCMAPYEIWEMLQLRHLDVNSYIHLPSDHKPDQADHLVMRNLRTLKCVKNFKMSEEACRRVPNIKELHVDYDVFFCRVSSYYCPHNLGSFHKLESLDCRLGWSSLWREFALSLTFPSSLKKLSLANAHLEWEEMAMMVGSLPRLETLRLEYQSVIDPEWNPVEGKFLRLKNLSIRRCEDLVYWNITDSSCFPVLECLGLFSLSRLDEFPSGIGEIPTLRSIVLNNCSPSSAISAVRVVAEQVEELGNEELRLQVCIANYKERESFMRKVEEEGLTTNNLRVDAF